MGRLSGKVPESETWLKGKATTNCACADETSEPLATLSRVKQFALSTRLIVQTLCPAGHVPYRAHCCTALEASHLLFVNMLSRAISRSAAASGASMRSATSVSARAFSAVSTLPQACTAACPATACSISAQAAPGAVPITVAHGDGIGPEIMSASLKVLEAAGANIAVEPIAVGEQVRLGALV